MGFAGRINWVASVMTGHQKLAGHDRTTLNPADSPKTTSEAKMEEWSYRIATPIRSSSWICLFSMHKRCRLQLEDERRTSEWMADTSRLNPTAPPGLYWTRSGLKEGSVTLSKSDTKAPLMRVMSRRSKSEYGTVERHRRREDPSFGRIDALRMTFLKAWGSV